ncbi:alpha/beta hydrolase [Paenibacillus sp. A3]|uniref:alpha/beta hydrolase n=1 Tax=Paenibacillus sp. A3 TaxID=1337054 RepID=UPI0007C6D10C|nr:alpha/beta hydrolase [Paenibacillus sp. A3]
MWRQVRFGRSRDIVGLVEEPAAQERRTLIVTLPGLGQAMSEKNYLLSNLRKRLAASGAWVVQFDYRGHGDSAGELGQTTVSSMVCDTLEVVEEATAGHRPDTIFFVGNALGAVVALRSALAWEERSGITCKPVLLSPPALPLPRSGELLDAGALNALAREGSVDSQLLVPGYDYYTLSDFDMDQVGYLASLGAHLLYLHGQCIGRAMLDELDALSEEDLPGAGRPGIAVVCGERDIEALEQWKAVPGAEVHLLDGVVYYFQHPAAMDQAIEIIAGIVLRGQGECSHSCAACPCGRGGINRAGSNGPDPMELR